MGFFQAILDAIANNYIFFVAITIFLVLSLIGFYVDKKTRKDADISPIFGNKVSLNIRKKDPSAKKDKKGKKGFTTTIVGEEDPAPAGVATVASQNITVGNAQVAPQTSENAAVQALPQEQYNAQNMQTSPQGLNSYAQGITTAPIQTPVVAEAQQNNPMVQTLPDGTVVDPSLFADIPGQANTTPVMPAAETAQIAETILPNVATTPVQAQVQGISAAAPGMEAIVPNVQPQAQAAPGQNDFESEGMNLNMGDEDSGAMNFNMTED